jgi:hypothetical protein
MLAKALRNLPLALPEDVAGMTAESGSYWVMSAQAARQFYLLRDLKRESVALAEERLPGAKAVGWVGKLRNPHRLPRQAFLFRLRLVMPIQQEGRGVIARRLEPFEAMNFEAFLYSLMGRKPLVKSGEVRYGLHVPLTTAEGLVELEALVGAVKHGLLA